MPESDGLPQGTFAASKNFFAEVMAGDFGLGATYWFLGVVGGLLLMLPIWVVRDALGQPGVASILSLIYLAYIIPVMIGVWNAAGKYEGRKVWAVAARIVVVIQSVRIVAALVTVLFSFFALA